VDRRNFLLGSGLALTALTACSDDAEAAGAPPDGPPDKSKKAGEPKPPPLPVPKLGPQPPDGRQVAYAQQGEDMVIMQALSMLGVRAPRYLDIGAFHPTIGSNTYLAYLSGGHGVLVEPNPPMAKMLAEVRTRDVVIDAGVGTGDATEADYYLMRDRPQLNTFSKAQVDRYVAEGGTLEKTIKMKLVSIDALLEEHFAEGIDLLSVDVEGLDLQILHSMNPDGPRPAVICVETSVYGTTGLVPEIFSLLAERGYAARGGSMINTVFVDVERMQAKAPEGAAVKL
jgi:FkbM family methyltransferase